MIIFFFYPEITPRSEDKENLKVQKLLRQEDINFQTELKKFLPASHATHLRDFKKILEQKILGYL